MSSNATAQLECRAKQAEDTIAWLKEQMSSLQNAAQSAELQRLQEENKQLQAEVNHWTDALNKAETKNGVKQVPMSGKPSTAVTPKAPAATLAAAAPPTTTAAPAAAQPAGDAPAKKKEKKPKAGKSEGGKAAAGGGDEETVDIGLLDLRVGRILSAEKHPDADALYVEQVDVGEPTPRTVVSGLVRFVPLEQMQNRTAVLLCNLKPAKMRGVLSQAMVMCASSPDKVEILDPPQGAQPGEAVTCPGFVSRCGAQLNPKKKIFEQVAPDLKTDGERRATYRGVAWEVAGKGAVTSPSLANVNIK